MRENYGIFSNIELFSMWYCNCYIILFTQMAATSVFIQQWIQRYLSSFVLFLLTHLQLSSILSHSFPLSLLPFDYFSLNLLNCSHQLLYLCSTLHGQLFMLIPLTILVFLVSPPPPPHNYDNCVISDDENIYLSEHKHLYGLRMTSATDTSWNTTSRVFTPCDKNIYLCLSFKRDNGVHSSKRETIHQKRKKWTR